VILDDARNVRDRLLRAEAATSDIEEARNLSTIKAELHGLVNKVANLAERRIWLKVGGVSLSDPPDDLVKVKQISRMLATRFLESPKSSTLVDRQRWRNLTDALARFQTVEETQQRQDWKIYFDTKLFGGVPPEQREQTILMSLPENQEALGRYKNLYKRLAAFRTVLPSTFDEFKDLQKCSDELSQIQFIENKDVPSAVREFFKATASGTGAHLDLLTSEVIAWLRTNSMLNHFAIKAKWQG
jgi:hypothetical protein